ncbi:transporter substrate-binding domain-containing protein [Maridesulfovibrio sp.]|uniref:substrate-binding periplasmic protein n=1 Tax=Maridesulfovibrio sp. TaxID=2795000 RepID=UPI002A18D06B|nr:transporter substrate-binding domain-containing protein [Maridesulfovibrio sp.]
MKIKFQVVTVILFLVLLVCSAEAGTYTLVSLDYPPYGYLENGVASGCDVEIIQEAFRRMGEEVEFKFFPWKRALAMASHGLADGMFLLLKTPERCEYMEYSDPVRLESMAFFVRSDSTIDFNGDLASLDEYSFGVIKDFLYGKEIDKYIKDKLWHRVETADSVQTNLSKLIKGRFDIFISDDLSTFYTARKIGVLSGIRRLLPTVGQNPVYVSFCKKNNTALLRDRFNKALKSMKDDGTWEAVIQKYRNRYINDFPNETFIMNGGAH